MANRHEWTEGGGAYGVEGGGTVYEILEEVGPSPQCGEIPRFVARELLRLAERDKISQHNLENAYADRDAVRGIAEALRRDVEAAERHCEEMEKRNAELEAALPKLQEAVDALKRADARLVIVDRNPPAPRNCDHCGKPLTGGLVLIPGKGGGPESFASVHGLVAFVEAHDKDSDRG